MQRRPVDILTRGARAVLLTAALLLAPFVLRVAAQAPRQIEEIIVTAQKTEQSLQDVPISMSVLGGEFLKQESITDFRDLALHLPNTLINNSSQYPDIRVRGFGSPFANKAFEQPVALVIDGIPYGRALYWLGPLFDLERVEALRGPQGTLFGKNATAGLFNVVTKKPTDELTGFVDAELGEFDTRRFEGAVRGPFLPSVRSEGGHRSLEPRRVSTLSPDTRSLVSGAGSTSISPRRSWSTASTRMTIRRPPSSSAPRHPAWTGSSASSASSAWLSEGAISPRAFSTSAAGSRTAATGSA